MKILTITSNDLGISWGPAIHYLELWNEVVEHSDFEVVGISPSWTKKETIVQSSFKLKSIQIPDLRGVRQIIYDSKVFYYLILNHKKYDLIYIRLSHWHLLQTIFFLVNKKKFVLEINGLAKEDSISSKKSFIYSYIVKLQEKWLVENAQLNICVSSGIENTLKKRYKKNINTITIANGVATSFFRKNYNKKNTSSQLKVGYVGTFTSWDGAADISKLARYFPNIDFIMVGHGDLKAEIQESAPENVIFTGKLDYSQLPEFYASIDAAIVLYEFERHRNVKVSSLKTLEYVASSLPIFSTNINGQEFIQENDFGLLLEEEGNLVESFDKFISSLDNYKNSYKFLDYNLVDVFGWKKTALKTIQAIKKLKL